MPDNYQTFDIRVTGGNLRVGSWGMGEKTVLAVHGLTTNHRAFHIVADALGPDYTVIAPDLRGRGASRDLGEPYGIMQHADDVASILRNRRISVDVAVGHSMGGSVVLQLAHTHPELVRSLVLVDGGLPREASSGHVGRLSVAESLRTRTGPAFERLESMFETVEAYLALLRNDPALDDEWNSYAEELYTYDLVGTPPFLRSSVNTEAVLADSAPLARAMIGEVIHDVKPSMIFVGASHGFYSDDILDHWRKELPHLTVIESPGTNHSTVLMGKSGAQFLAKVIREVEVSAPA